VSTSGTSHLLGHQRDCKVKLAKQRNQSIQHLNHYENDALLRHVVASMKSKFLKY
jgi:hypothetical protein